MLILLLVLLSFIAAFLDTGFGMGYGTILTPLLILFNFPILETVPAVLLAQIVAAIATAIAFQIHGNVHFTLSSEDTKMAAVLSLAGVVGAVVGITIFYIFFSLNYLLLQTYIGIAVLFVGILVFREVRWQFSWSKMTTLGALAAINKGLSGGGYTPIIAGGQMLSGRTSTQSIGCTMISKGVVSVVAVSLYLILGHLIFDPIFILMTIPLILGAIIAAPLASYLVKQTTHRQMNTLIGLSVITLGASTIIKSLIDFII